METINNFYVNYEPNTVTFYDDNGVIFRTNSTYSLKYDDSKPIKVLNILKNKSKFRKAETRNAFIEKCMKEKINFYYQNAGGVYPHLYLYVDNEYIKLIKEDTYTKIEPNESTLELLYYEVANVELEIFGVHVTGSEIRLDKIEKQEELAKQATELYNEINEYVYIGKNSINALFNRYKLVKRDTPLLGETRVDK